MDWSASLSLTTSRKQQHRPNYGSFSSSAAPLKRLGSASTISIPQSIPEHQCVLQFSPRLQHAELQVIEQYEIIGADASKRLTGRSTTTLTITETPESSRLHTFKMLLTNPSASSVINRLDSSSSKLSVAAPAASDDTGSSYWLQERERMRLQRERRHLLRNGSPTKASTLRDEEDPETSQWKTAAIMCSVPLVLVLVFVVVTLMYGDGLQSVDDVAHHFVSDSRLRGSASAASHGGSPSSSPSV